MCNPLTLPVQIYNFHHIPVDHRLVFTLPKQLVLSDDECNFADGQLDFRLELRFSNGALANLCPNPEEGVHLHQGQQRKNNPTAATHRIHKGREEGEGDDGSDETLLVSDGNRILIRFSTAGDARRLYSAFPEGTKPQPLLPVKLHFKTGKRAEKSLINLFMKPDCQQISASLL